jgi:23S rRNA (uracil1939-C5)-methyltransferase
MIVLGGLTTTESSCSDSSRVLCSVATRCGGCPRISEPVRTQREAKASHVARLLSSLAVPTPRVAGWVCGPEVGYRNRIRLAVVGGIPRFFNSEKAISCVVLEPALQLALKEFLKWAEAYKSELVPFRVAEVRAPDADGTAAVYLRHTERNGEPFPAPPHSEIPNVFRAGVVAFEDGVVEYQRVYATTHAWLWSPVGAFGQINTLVNQRMVQTVVDWLVRRQTRTFLDLFAGSGNFSIPLLSLGMSGTAVEWDRIACDAHLRTIHSHGFDAMTVVQGDALGEAQRLDAAGYRCDAIVLDPPRRGLRGQVGAVAKLARSTIVLVSCNATQFALDAAALCAHGFKITDYRLVDMFPHTDHVELIACFDRA